MAVATFGESVKRTEDPRLITGRGKYVDDVRLTGMAHLAFVRSPYGHANIKSINTQAALDSPGVIAVFTGADLQEELGGLPVGWMLPDLKQPPHPPLASLPRTCPCLISQRPCGAMFRPRHLRRPARRPRRAAARATRTSRARGGDGGSACQRCARARRGSRGDALW